MDEARRKADLANMDVRSCLLDTFVLALDLDRSITVANRIVEGLQVYVPDGEPPEVGPKTIELALDHIKQALSNAEFHVSDIQDKCGVHLNSAGTISGAIEDAKNALPAYSNDATKWSGLAEKLTVIRRRVHLSLMKA